MARLWFKDGTYMDVPTYDVHYWEMDANLDRIEYPILDKNGNTAES